MMANLSEQNTPLPFDSFPQGDVFTMCPGSPDPAARQFDSPSRIPHRIGSWLIGPGSKAGRGTLLALTVMLFVPTANLVRADSRVQRPVQIQLDLYGVSLGYHFSDLVYVGATRQFGVGGNRFHGGHMFDDSGHGHEGHNAHDESGLYGQDGVLDDNFDYGNRTSVEMRFSPEPFGVYLALGALLTEQDKEQVVWDERSRVVGQGSYTTGLTANIEGRSSTVPALGAGINHVFSGGLSLGAGFLVGTQKLESPKVKVAATNFEVSDADLERFRKKVRDEFNDLPLMVHLAIGYNF